MDIKYQRRLDLNEWIIAARWFYLGAIFLVGVLGNSLLSLFDVGFSLVSVTLLFILFLALNGLFYRVLDDIKKIRSENKLQLLSLGQIFIELFFLTLIMYMGGDKGMIGVFYFLPIISAAMIFGVRGGVLVAILSAVLVNSSVVLDYFYYAVDNVFDRGPVDLFQLNEWRYHTMSLIKTVTTSNFYLVIGIFSGYGTNFLFSREQKLIDQAKEMEWQNKMRQQKVEKLNQDASRLEEQDKQLKHINSRLNQKVKELEKSERSLMRAFSDLQEARRQIEEEQNRISAIISNFVDPIILIGKNGGLSLINPAAKNIFGFLDDDLGKMVPESNNYAMENFKTIIKKDFEVHAGGKKNLPKETEEVVVESEGQSLTYKVVTAKVLDNDGVYLGVMKIFYNVTREKMIDEMKTEFISIAAHQLRTPLSSIKWGIKMVLSGDVGKLNKDQVELLDSGYKSNERMIGLVNDMLDVSRIEEGRFGYDFAVEDFVEALDPILEVIQAQINEKQIRFSIHKPEKVPKVEMDKKKMNLVLQNLLENAVKYTPEYGKIEVFLEPGNNFLRVRIRDNGVGIPEKDQSKLFSKFFRANNVIRMQTEGSGLGLFIVKNIIAKHGGDITFHSEEGRGTEFVFTIPYSGKKNNNSQG